MMHSLHSEPSTRRAGVTPVARATDHNVVAVASLVPDRIRWMVDAETPAARATAATDRPDMAMATLMDSATTIRGSSEAMWQQYEVIV